MPWKRRHNPGLTGRQALLVVIACMLTGMLACWLGSGTDKFYNQVSAKFSGACDMLSGGSAGVSPAMMEKYRNANR